MIGDTNHGTLTFRGATFAAVTLENPVLAAFEPHVAINGSGFVFKIGDGIRAYNDLPNLVGAGSGGGGGSGGLSVVDNLDGTLTLDGTAVVDNLDGTLTIGA